MSPVIILLPSTRRNEKKKTNTSKKDRLVVYAAYARMYCTEGKVCVLTGEDKKQLDDMKATLFPREPLLQLNIASLRIGADLYLAAC